MTSSTFCAGRQPTGREFSDPPATPPFRLSFQVLECTAANEPDRDKFKNRRTRFEQTFGGDFWVLPEGNLVRKNRSLDFRGWLEGKFPRLFPRRATAHVVLSIDLCSKENSDHALGLPYDGDEPPPNLKPGFSTARWKLDLVDEDPSYRDSIVFFNGEFFLASVIENHSFKGKNS